MAEIPQDKEFQILEQIKSWTLKQSKGRIYDESAAAVYSADGVVVATVIKNREPKVLFCSPRLVGEIKDAGLTFKEPQKKK